MYYLKGNVISGGTITEGMYVEITNHEITYVGKELRQKNYPVYPVNNGFICPGFIDIHIHGVSGNDFMDHKRAFSEIAKQLPLYGVTSFLATSRTALLDDIIQFLTNAKNHQQAMKNGAEMLGVHLEGPWISKKFSGAQDQELIRKLTLADIKHVIDPYQDLISMITLAPEELDDLSMITNLASKGIHISAGHTNATIDELEMAMKAGLTQTTHTFNAMSPVHHRNPGTSAAALYFEALTCELITDGLHIHPKIVELLYRVKGHQHLMFVSDCTGYNHLADGAYSLRNKELIKQGNKVTLKDGTLAGSAITLDKGIKYAVEKCNIPLEKAVFMATESPMQAFKTSRNLGKIAAGYQANVAILNPNLSVKETIINGKTAYKEKS